MAYLRKRCVVNPTRGPFHFRAPSRMFYRTIRGMVPHKSPRGAAALARLRVFEGIPPPYDRVKRMVIPDALKVLRLHANRKYTVLKRLSAEFGWKYANVLEELEEKRKAKGSVYYEKKKAIMRVKALATKKAEKDLTKVTKVLTSFGY